MMMRVVFFILLLFLLLCFFSIVSHSCTPFSGTIHRMHTSTNNRLLQQKFTLTNYLFTCNWFYFFFSSSSTKKNALIDRFAIVEACCMGVVSYKLNWFWFSRLHSLFYCTRFRIVIRFARVAVKVANSVV